MQITAICLDVVFHVYCIILHYLKYRVRRANIHISDYNMYARFVDEFHK